MQLPNIVLQILEFAAFVGVTGVLFEGLSRILRSLAKRAGVKRPTLTAIRDWLRLGWLSVSAVALLSIFTQLTSQLTVLTVGGIVGLVISLALQTTLSNMVSGLLLLHDRALRLGDVIEFSGVKGRVVRVALRNTWVMTESGQVAIVGNSSLLGGPLVNHTASQRFAADFGE